MSESRRSRWMMGSSVLVSWAMVARALAPVAYGSWLIGQVAREATFIASRGVDEAPWLSHPVSKVAAGLGVLGIFGASLVRWGRTFHRPSRRLGLRLGALGAPFVDVGLGAFSLAFFVLHGFILPLGAGPGTASGWTATTGEDARTWHGIPWVALLGVFGVAASAWLVSRSIYRALVAWGLSVTERERASARFFCSAFAILIGMFGVDAVVHSATGASLLLPSAAEGPTP